LFAVLSEEADFLFLESGDETLLTVGASSSSTSFSEGMSLSDSDSDEDSSFCSKKKHLASDWPFLFRHLSLYLF